MDGSLGKKKRGRPRRYGPVAHTSSPLPISTSSAPASSGFFHKNQATSSAICGSFGYITSPPATNLVSAEKPRKGRPIGSQNKPRHNVGQENIGELIACTSGGSFTPHTITVNAGEDPSHLTISGGASSSRVGSMSITLAQPDGQVVGGLLAGLLIAASPLQPVVVASFLPINHIEKPKKHRYEHKLARSTTGFVTRLPPRWSKMT